ncbi:MAG: hypothetical protein JSW55_05675 [Chloroflexota bacterium]|nr:MAG: hypothetical protein JSW55_05675 [Chloroflexota bacterium]
MTVESPRIRSLLRQADRVAESGKRAAAEQLYREIIDEAPEAARAWYGLAQVAKDQSEREAALRQATTLDPDIELAAAMPGSPDGADEAGHASEANDAAGSTFSVDGHGHSHRVVDRTQSEGSEHETTSIPAPEGTVETGIAEEEAVALFCANHPGRETHLRCNRCGKPICSSCANPTPVGYRCPECIREQEDVYFSATAIDYLLVVLIVFPLSLAAGWLAARLGFWSIFLAAFAGTLIGRVAFRVARRRRGRWLPQLASACVVIGGVLPALPFLLAIFFGHFSLQLLFTGVYIVLASGATYYQMR